MNNCDRKSRSGSRTINKAFLNARDLDRSSRVRPPVRPSKRRRRSVVNAVKAAVNLGYEDKSLIDRSERGRRIAEVDRARL